MQTFKLKSGKYYSLNQIFNYKSNHRIIIPDLQRDYCWGNDEHGPSKTELVSSFLDNIFDAFNDYKDKSLKELNLGLIYAYENPEDFIQLCDGQQRLTTLFLLIGLLYIKTNDKCLLRMLVSEKEQEDDNEPFLYYSIRENTLYFLSDLVNNFFINSSEINNSIEENIRNQSWYNKDCDLDPSVQSMIKALDIINEKIEEFLNIDNINFFVEFLCSKIKVLYYDMENREHGEEMFVIINTRGEPLEPTETIKPILLFNEEKYNNEWEIRADYFWKNKTVSEDSSDQGYNNFLCWYLKIKLFKDKIDLLKDFKKLISEGDSNKNKKTILDELNEYFITIRAIINFFKKNNERLNFLWQILSIKNPSTISDLRNFTEEEQNNILLPLLLFMVKISKSENDIYYFLRRIRKNFSNNREPERQANYYDWRYLLQIIDKSINLNEFLQFDKLLKETSNISLPDQKWYNNEEKLKQEIFNNFKNIIEEWEDLDDFRGDLSPIFRMLLCQEKITSINNANNDLENIFISDKEYEYFLNKRKNIKDVFENLKHYVAIYLFIEDIKSEDSLFEIYNRYDLLKVRYCRSNIWSGNYRFGREQKNYFRWNFKYKKVFYQEWFYILCIEIYERNLLENHTDFIIFLKTINKNIIYQLIDDPSLNFFNTKLLWTSKNISVDLLDFHSKLSKKLDSTNTWENQASSRYCLGFLWAYLNMLKFTYTDKEEKYVNPEEEIIFDNYVEDNLEPFFLSIGNVFLRPKSTKYYEDKIELFDGVNDEEPYYNYLKIKSDQLECRTFISEREKELKMLFDIEFD